MHHGEGLGRHSRQTQIGDEGAEIAGEGFAHGFLQVSAAGFQGQRIPDRQPLKPET
jgi:hypothetical protein